MISTVKSDEGVIQAWRQVLTSHGWLSSLPDPFRSNLLSQVTWVTFDPGEHLFLAGEEDRRELLGLCEGVVTFTAGMGPADTPPLHLARPPSWFGHSTLFTGAPTRVTVTARTGVRVARVTGSRVRQMLSAHPEWWPFFMQLVGLYGDAAVTIATDLAIRGSERRLVAVLLRMSGHRHPAAGPALAAVPIGQAELAAACNMSRNTANTILVRLASLGLIAVTRGEIDILNSEALMDIAAL